MICAPKTWADLIHACSLAWFKRYSRWRHKKIWRIFLHESFHETWKALNICTQCTSINQTIEIEYKQLIQVVRGRAGAEVSEGKNHKPKKEFAYRMRARRPTAKPSFLCEGAFSRSMMAMYRGEVTCFDTWGWLQSEMKKCGWLWGDVRWGNVTSREMSFHVM